MLEKPLDISAEEERFWNHLKKEENERILFSGIFGIGKSFFINKFKEDYLNEVKLIRLSPVNYSVSSNEDIFEYIKYDICLQLFGLNPKFDKLDFNSNFFLSYIGENLPQFISTLVKISGSLYGSGLQQAIEHIDNARKQIKDSYDKFDQRNELLKYLRQSNETLGSINEQNFITELINEILAGLKNEDEKPRLYGLVIDDLDRIDPDHIFRLLNVFSAHLDADGDRDKNKFGFDKVIFVCDLENVRNIFHSRYGVNTDFSGYIDKFYSDEVFYYDFKNIITNNITSLLDSTRVTDKFPYLKVRQNFTLDLAYLIIDFFKYNTLSLRRFISFLNNPLAIPSVEISSPNGHSIIQNTSSPIFLLFDILILLAGGEKELIQMLEKVHERKPVVGLKYRFTNWRTWLGNLCLVIDQDRNKLKRTKQPIQTKINESLYIRYEVGEVENDLTIGGYIGIEGRANGTSFGAISVVKDRESDNLEVDTIDFYNLLILAFNRYRSMRKIEVKTVPIRGVQ